MVLWEVGSWTGAPGSPLSIVAVGGCGTRKPAPPNRPLLCPQTMLKLIQKKLLDKICDQVMEFSWSALWNITDETPDNCEMFLNFNGMKLFLDCLKVSSQGPLHGHAP